MDISAYEVDDDYVVLTIESGNTAIKLCLSKDHETRCNEAKYIMEDLFHAHHVIKDFLGINEEDTK